MLYNLGEPLQFTFQNAATLTMREVEWLHDYVTFYLVLIIVSVSWILFNFIIKRTAVPQAHLLHGSTLEIIWTIAPAVILSAIAFPSFKLLYLMEEVQDPAVTLKAIGHQWYWSYQYTDYLNENNEGINYDSYMIPTQELETGDFRLLEVDNPVVVPINTSIRVLITSADVLHAWTVPALGVKMDAVPGRLNQTGFFVQRTGTFYGQCSELCGANHAFMPIKVQAVTLPHYCAFIAANL